MKNRFLDYSYIFNKYNYGNLRSFQIEMKAYGMPNYIHRYCEDLDELGWMIFYSKMLVPMEIIKDIEDLIYLLKWILKEDPEDFTYSLYVYEMMCAEGRDYIKEEYFSMLSDKYHDQFLEDFAPKDPLES